MVATITYYDHYYYQTLFNSSEGDNMPKREMPEAKIMRLYQELTPEGRRIVFGLLQNEQPKKARTAKKPSSKKATAATAEVADSNDNS
jgi:hypothetical protein